MKRVILSKEWGNDAISRQKAVEEREKHPFTLDELIEQQRRNEHIRQKDILGSKD